MARKTWIVCLISFLILALIRVAPLSFSQASGNKAKAKPQRQLKPSSVSQSQAVSTTNASRVPARPLPLADTQATTQDSIRSGIARTKDDPTSRSRLSPDAPGDMTYHNGPVQHTQKIFTVFWFPLAIRSRPATKRPSTNLCRI